MVVGRRGGAGRGVGEMSSGNMIPKSLCATRLSSLREPP